MSKKIFIRYLLICVFCFSSCISKPTSNRNTTINSLSNRNVETSLKFYTVKHNKYLTFDTLRFIIPNDANINSNNVYNGIYELKGNSFIRHKTLTFNNLAFLTTFENLGTGIRSRLYVFDTRNKLLIKDSTFKRSYLYSSAGIFIIDRSTNKIFSVDKPEWYSAKQASIITAAVCNIKEGYFNHLKNVYKVGNEIPTDTSLVSFFNKSMLANNKEVLVLPMDWWKTKE